MLNVLLNIFFITIIFVFQNTIIYSFTILDVRPDIILILVAFIGFYLGEDKGAIMGFLLGFIQDCLSTGLLGANAFSKGVIGFIFGNLRGKIMFGNALSRVIFILSACFIDSLVILLISFLTGLNEEAMATILKKLLFAAVYTSLTAPFLLEIFLLINKKKHGGLSKVKKSTDLKYSLTKM